MAYIRLPSNNILININIILLWGINNAVPFSLERSHMITSLLILRVNFFFYLQDHLAYIHLAFRQIRLRLTFFIFDAFEVFVLFHFEATFRHLSPSPEFYVVELFVPTTTAQEKQGSEAARERAS